MLLVVFVRPAQKQANVVTHREWKQPFQLAAIAFFRELPVGQRKGILAVSYSLGWGNVCDQRSRGFDFAQVKNGRSRPSSASLCSCMFYILTFLSVRAKLGICDFASKGEDRDEKQNRSSNDEYRQVANRSWRLEVETNHEDGERSRAPDYRASPRVFC